MPTTENKGNPEYEDAKYQLQEIKTDISIIKNHAKWVLSLVAVIALGLASFIFKDYGELPILYKNVEKADLFIRIFAGVSLLFYSSFIMAFMPLILWGVRISNHDYVENFTELSQKQKSQIINTKIKQNHEKLLAIDERFKRLIAIIVASPFVISGISAYFTYII